MNVKPQIWRADCKLILRFLNAPGTRAPNSWAVHGSTVCICVSLGISDFVFHIFFPQIFILLWGFINYTCCICSFMNMKYKKNEERLGGKDCISQIYLLFLILLIKCQDWNLDLMLIFPNFLNYLLRLQRANQEFYSSEMQCPQQEFCSFFRALRFCDLTGGLHKFSLGSPGLRNRKHVRVFIRILWNDVRRIELDLMLVVPWQIVFDSLYLTVLIQFLKCLILTHWRLCGLKANLTFKAVEV